MTHHSFAQYCQMTIGDDILHIEFSQEPIVKDVSYGWNINIGLQHKGSLK